MNVLFEDEQMVDRVVDDLTLQGMLVAARFALVDEAPHPGNAPNNAP